MTSNTISISELKEKIRPIFESYPVNKAILFGRGTFCLPHREYR